MDLKKKIEAALFITGRFMSAEEIARMVDFNDKNAILQALKQLKDEYSSRDSALIIEELNNKWKLNVKKEFLHMTEKFLKDTELDFPTQETLAIIAYKQPVLQADVIKIRGTKAYEHIKLLRELGFITAEKHGRTRMLRLTQKFFEYFDVVDDKIKEKNEN